MCRFLPFLTICLQKYLFCHRIRNEREAATRRKYKEEQERKERERKRREEEERRKELERQEEERQRQRAMSPEFQTISLSTGNEEFDKEFGIKGMDTFMIKTSPMPSQFMRELDEELNASKDDDDDDDIRTDLKEDKTDFSLDIPVVCIFKGSTFKASCRVFVMLAGILDSRTTVFYLF